jgi:hypothetical protein
MAAANASTRGQRAAILASPLSELTGFCLAVDCMTLGCTGERTFGGHRLGDLLRRAANGARRAGPDEVRWCLSRACGRRVAGHTGSVLNTRVRPRRVARQENWVEIAKSIASDQVLLVGVASTAQHNAGLSIAQPLPECVWMRSRKLVPNGR